jgi:hypothetical protein
MGGAVMGRIVVCIALFAGSCAMAAISELKITVFVAGVGAGIWLLNGVDEFCEWLDRRRSS